MTKDYAMVAQMQSPKWGYSLNSIVSTLPELDSILRQVKNGFRLVRDNLTGATATGDDAAGFSGDTGAKAGESGAIPNPI